MQLEIGEEYISYAQNYHDSYKDLIAELKAKGFGHVSMEPYDPAKLKVPSEDQVRRFKQMYGIPAGEGLASRAGAGRSEPPRLHHHRCGQGA